jgi:hypothetical protein
MRGYCVKSFSKAFPLTTRKQILYEKIRLKNTWQVMARIAIAHWPSSQEENKLVPFHLQAGCSAIEKTMNVFFFQLQCWPNRSSTSIYSGGLLSETKKKRTRTRINLRH